MENLKFRANSPEHSIAIQNRLFELGYKWIGGDVKPICTNFKNLFTNKDGTICHGYSSDDTFKESSKEEATLNDLYAQKQSVSLDINDEYAAEYEKGSNEVRIGCQKIKVTKIKELIYAIDELNSENLD